MPPPGFTAPLTAISKSGLGNDISNGSPHCNPSRTSSQDAPAQPHHPPASIRADREWAQHSREVRRDALAAYRPPHTPLLAASALAASTSPSPSPLLAPFHLTQLRCAAACMLAGVRAGPAGVHSADAAHLAAQLQAGDPGSWWELCLGAGEQGWRGPGPTPPTATHSPAPTVHGMEDAGPGSAMDRRVQFAQSAGDAAITVSEAAVAALADGGALRVLGAPEGQVVLVLDADLLRQAALEAAVSCCFCVGGGVGAMPKDVCLKGSVWAGCLCAWVCAPAHSTQHRQVGTPHSWPPTRRPACAVRKVSIWNWWWQSTPTVAGTSRRPTP